MKGFLFEFGFTIFDYTFLLLAFLLFRSKPIRIKRVLFAVLFVSVIQVLIEMIIMPRYMIFLKDTFITICFLMSYDEEFSSISFTHALMIDALFMICFSFYITIAQLCSYDIVSELEYDLYHVIFTINTKIFIFSPMLILMHLFKKINVIVSDRICLIFLSCFIVCEILASILLEVSVGEKSPNAVMIILVGIMFLILYMVTNYGMVKKKNDNVIMLQQLIDIMNFQIEENINEQKQIKHLIHDMKNNLLEIEFF